MTAFIECFMLIGGNGLESEEISVQPYFLKILAEGAVTAEAGDLFQHLTTRFYS